MTEWLEFFNAYRATTQHLVAFLLAGAIWRWGGGPERWLMGSFLATMVLPVYVVWWLRLGAAEVGPYAPFMLMVDLLATALFVAIALQANRNYPLWIAGFQIVALVAHMARAMVEDGSTLAFAILIIGPSYCQLLVLIGGSVRHWLRERRFGTYRDWRLSPPGLRWLRP